jgi:2-keto-4-pentenoate hydratase/2-oxohepta-3-ene-1,7-dioic acid hydratase in catechol pathway
MRWVRVATGDEIAYGVVDGGSVRLGAGDPFAGWTENGATIPLERARLLAPVRPTKIVAVGLNYRDHAAEMRKALPEEPLLFSKPPSALLDPGGTILLPPESAEVHYEGELAVVIGRRCRRVRREDARGAILGYTVMIDVTARDLQRKDVQYTRAKGFDTFAPLGPWIDTVADPRDLAIETRVGGEVRQRSRTRELIFTVDELVAFVSRVMTLEPGDVISTGTPSGVGALRDGDEIEVEIESVGVLRCRVAAERRS